MENQLLSGICRLLCSPNAVQSKCNSNLIKHCFIHKLYSAVGLPWLTRRSQLVSFVVGELPGNLLAIYTAAAPLKETSWRSPWARAGFLPSLRHRAVTLQWEWNELLPLALVHLSKKTIQQRRSPAEVGCCGCTPDSSSCSAGGVSPQGKAGKVSVKLSVVHDPCAPCRLLCLDPISGVAPTDAGGGFELHKLTELHRMK